MFETPIDSLSSGFPIGTSRKHVFGDHELPGLVDMQKATWNMAQSKYWIFQLKIVIFQLCKRLPEGIQMRDSYGISIWFLWYFYNISMGFLVLVSFWGHCFQMRMGYDESLFIHIETHQMVDGIQHLDSLAFFIGWGWVAMRDWWVTWLSKPSSVQTVTDWWLSHLCEKYEFVTWGCYSQYMEK